MLSTTPENLVRTMAENPICFQLYKRNDLNTKQPFVKSVKDIKIKDQLCRQLTNVIKEYVLFRYAALSEPQLQSKLPPRKPKVVVIDDLDR